MVWMFESHSYISSKFELKVKQPQCLKAEVRSVALLVQRLSQRTVTTT